MPVHGSASTVKLVLYVTTVEILWVFIVIQWGCVKWNIIFDVAVSFFWKMWDVNPSIFQKHWQAPIFWPLIFETPATIIRQSSNTFVCNWDKFYLPGHWKSSEEHGNFHIWYAEYTNGAKLWRKTPFGHNFLELLCTYICIDCGFWIKKFCCLVIKFTPNMPLHSEEYSCE